MDRSEILTKLVKRCREASVETAAAHMRGDILRMRDESLIVSGYAELIEMLKRPRFYSMSQEGPVNPRNS